MNSSVDLGNLDLSSFIDPTMFSGASGKDVETLVRERLMESLNELEFKIDSMIESLGEAERHKLKKLKEHLREYRDHMEKVAKSQKFSNVLKALGILGFLLALVASIFVPNPLTISLLVVTTVMLFEPMIAEAMGKQSMFQTMMQEIFQAFRSTLGEVGAAIAAALILFAAFLLMSGATAAGISAVARLGVQAGAQATGAASQGARAGTQAAIQGGSKIAGAGTGAGNVFGQAASQATSQFTKAIQTFGQQLKDMFSSWNRLKEMLGAPLKTTPQQDAAINKLLNTLQFGTTMAMGGVQFEFATVRKEAAEHLHDAEVALALQDFWNGITDLINADVDLSFNEFEELFSNWRLL